MFTFEFHLQYLTRGHSNNVCNLFCQQFSHSVLNVLRKDQEKKDHTSKTVHPTPPNTNYVSQVQRTKRSTTTSEMLRSLAHFYPFRLIWNSWFPDKYSTCTVTCFVSGVQGMVSPTVTNLKLRNLQICRITLQKYRHVVLKNIVDNLEYSDNTTYITCLLWEMFQLSNISLLTACVF